MTEKFEKIKILCDNAEKDIKTAETLAALEDGAFYSSIICFHCQQAIEKYLKAYLIYNETRPPKTHDLLQLAALCSDYDQVFVGFELDDFSGYGVDIRYDDPQPTFIDAKHAIAIANEVIHYVIEKIQ